MFRWIRRKRLPPEPARAKFPLSWVTLIFTIRGQDGQYRNAVEHFESEEMAAMFMRSARPEFLEGFKGAYKEVDGFLGRLDIADRHKKAFDGPSMPGPAAPVEHPKSKAAREIIDGPDPRTPARKELDEALDGLVDIVEREAWDELPDPNTVLERIPTAARHPPPEPLYFCASKYCPGLPYAASDRAHPCPPPPPRHFCRSPECQGYPWKASERSHTGVLCEEPERHLDRPEPPQQSASEVLREAGERG